MYKKNVVIDKEQYADVVDTSYCDDVYKGLKELMSQTDFDLFDFINNSKKASNMAITALLENNSEVINFLVSKKFIVSFNALRASYENKNFDFTTMKAKATGIYIYNKVAYIKIIFEDIQQEWTYTKLLTDSSPNWYLSNIVVHESS